MDFNRSLKATDPVAALRFCEWMPAQP